MKAIITCDLGFGDSSKGACVDFLCSRKDVDLVVCYCGGPQKSHRVVLPDGRIHKFSQFSSGTLRKVPTYIAPQTIVNLNSLHNEAEALKKIGITNPYGLLYIDDRCLVSTVYHRNMNALRELSRGKSNAHGTCAHGVGETRHYELKYGQDAIRMRDIDKPFCLEEKLDLVRRRMKIELQEFVGCLTQDQLKQYPLDINASVEANRLNEVRNHLWVWHDDFLPVAKPNSKVVFEGSQGLLLDEWVGFHPHTTWSTVTDQHAQEICDANAIEDRVVLGLVRAVTTRHGNGPLPTYSQELTEKLVDHGNPTNKWQGGFRVGHFDLTLFKYSLSAINKLDGLVVSHLDQYPGEIATSYCYSKEYPSFNSDFIFEGPNLNRQEELGRRLSKITQCNLQPMNESTLLSLLNSFAPVVIEGLGPTSLDRVLTAAADML